MFLFFLSLPAALPLRAARRTILFVRPGKILVSLSVDETRDSLAPLLRSIVVQSVPIDRISAPA